MLPKHPVNPGTSAHYTKLLLVVVLKGVHRVTVDSA